MNSKFTNKIVAFYPIHGKDYHKPVVYFNVIRNHTKSSLVLNVILGGIDESQDTFTLKLKIIRDDERAMFSSSYTVHPSEMSKKSLVQNTVVGLYTIGPLVFEIDDHSTHSYIASLDLVDSQGNAWDSAHTWFLSRPDKQLNRK